MGMLVLCGYGSYADFNRKDDRLRRKAKGWEAITLLETAHT